MKTHPTLAAAWLVVAVLAAASSAAAQHRPASVTLGPVKIVPGTHLVLAGINTSAAAVTVEVTYASTDGLLYQEEVVYSPWRTGVRGFGGDQSGVIGVVDDSGVTVTLTELDGDLDNDIIATLQLVDDDTDRPIAVLAMPCP